MRNFELSLPARPADDVIRERLAVLVDRFNRPNGDAAERVELHAEIVRLRRLLGAKEGA